jgi:hypothetical protein
MVDPHRVKCPTFEFGQRFATTIDLQPSEPPWQRCFGVNRVFFGSRISFLSFLAMCLN